MSGDGVIFTNESGPTMDYLRSRTMPRDLQQDIGPRWPETAGSTPTRMTDVSPPMDWDKLVEIDAERRRSVPRPVEGTEPGTVVVEDTVAGVRVRVELVDVEWDPETRLVPKVAAGLGAVSRVAWVAWVREHK